MIRSPLTSWEPILQVGTKTLTFLVTFLGMLIWPETKIKWLPKGSTGHKLNHLVCYRDHAHIYIHIYGIWYKLCVYIYMYTYTYHIYPSWTFLLGWFPDNPKRAHDLWLQVDRSVTGQIAQQQCYLVYSSASLRMYRGSPKVSGAKNAGTEPCKAILGVGFPLHKPYPYRLYTWVPPF